MDERVRIIPIVLLLSLSALLMVSQDTEAICPSSSSVTVALAQAKQTAYVAPGQDGMVTFTGTVFFQIPYEENENGSMVILTVDAGDFIVSSIEPLYFSKAQKQQSFLINVYVPIGTSHSTRGQLSVSGKWYALGSDREDVIYPATAIIFVKQFSRVELETAEGIVSIKQGQSAETRLLVQNKGNGEERVRFEISNLKDLEDEGWKVELGRDKITVEEGSSDNTSITIRPPRKIDLGIHNITVRSVVAQSLCGGEYSNYTLFIHVKEREVLGITYSFWVIIQLSLIIILVSVTAFIVIIKTHLTKKIRSKLSRKRE
jgi:hypothetical protein